MRTAKMIVYLTRFIFLLSSGAFAQSTRVVGHFGEEKIPIDFRFGDDVMVVTSHEPVNGHNTFRETSNLHIFSKRMVAMRNTLDKECYVKQFNATMDGMKEKVKHALKNNGDVGEVKEERLELEGMQPLGSEWVKRFLGPEIDKFCHLHAVYLISGANFRLLDPKEISPQRRERRDAVMESVMNDLSMPSRRRRSAFLSERGIMPSRRRWCPCRESNGERRVAGSHSRRGWRRCPPLCPCRDWLDTLVVC